MTTEASKQPVIYRVRARATHSVQPGRGATTWLDEVLYCGADRTAARVAYHRSAPQDYYRGYGNSARKTAMDVIEDAGTDDAADDAVTQTEEV